MKKIFYFFFAVATVIPAFVNATQFYWNATSGNWNAVSNWHLASFTGTTATSLPTSADSVYIGNGSNNATITLNVDTTIKNLTLEGSGQLFINGSGYTLKVVGNIYISNSNTTGGGSATINIGSGTTGIYSTTADGEGKLPNLTLSGSGTVYLSGYITMGGSTTLNINSSSFTGTLYPGTGGVGASGSSDIIFYYNNTVNVNVSLDNAEFQGSGSTFTIDNTLTLTNDLTISLANYCTLNSGTISISGNLYDLNTAGSTVGTATIVMAGSTTETYSWSSGTLCNLSITNTDSVKPASGTTGLAVRSLSISGGAFVAPSNTLLIYGAYSSLATIFSQATGSTFSHNNGTVSVNISSSANGAYPMNVLPTTLFYNLTVYSSPAGNASPYITSGSGDTVKVANTFTHSAGPLYGFWETMGNLVVGSGATQGTGEIFMIGSTTATYTCGTTGRTCMVMINKHLPGDSVLAAIGTSTLSVAGLVITSGIFIAPSNTLNIGSSYTALSTIFSQATGSTFIHNNGTVSVYIVTNANGAYPMNVLPTTLFYNLSVLSSPDGNASPYITSGSGDTVKVAKTFTHSGGVLNGFWETMGNLVVGSGANQGTGEIIMSDSATGTYTCGTTGKTCIVAINKPTGDSVKAASGTSILSVAGLVITSGIFIAPSNTLNIGTSYTAVATIFSQASGSTFMHNNGTVSVSIVTNANGAYTMNVLSSTLFYNLSVGSSPDGNVSPYITAGSGDTVKVANTFTHSAGAIDGFWETRKNLVVGSGANQGGGEIIMCDSTTGTYTCGTTGKTCVVAINKPTGDSVKAASGTSILSVSVLLITSGIFVAPSGTLNIEGSYTSGVTIFSQTTGSAFLHNNGTVAVSISSNASAGYTMSVLPTTLFYNLTLVINVYGGSPYLTTASGDTVKVTNNFTKTSGNLYGIWMAYTNATISTSIGGTAQLIFSGSGSKQLYASSGVTLYQLTMGKSSGTLTLENPVTLTNNLNLSKGIIVSTSTNLLTIASGATVSGGSDSSYVSGPVAKTGTAAFTFPIGGTVSGTPTYMPLAISAPTSSDTWTASYNYGSGSTSLYSLGTGVTYVDPCEYWLLTKSGSSSVKATLNWNSPCFHIASLSYVTAAYVNSSHTTWDSTNAYSTSGNTTTGSLTSKSHSLWDTVTIAKTNPLITITPTNTVICTGTSTTLGGDVSVSGGTGTLTYAWSPATGLSSTTATNPTANPTATTTYTLTVIDAITESSSATVVVTVNPLPGDNAGSNSTICNGATTVVGAAYTSGHTYSWSPATGVSCTGCSIPSASPITTTTYTLTETITATGCSTSNSVVVTVNPVPGDNAGGNATICNGSSTTIGEASTAGDTYSWSPSTGLSSSTVSNPTTSPTTTTTYTLTETITTTGCYATNSVSVAIDYPIVNAGLDTSITIGTTDTIGGNPTASGGSGSYSYVWAPSGTLNSSTIANPVASPTSSTFYGVTVTDNNSCTAAGIIGVAIIEQFLSNLDTESVPSSFAFYQNFGQIVDDNDNVRHDIEYYTISQSPAIYIREDTTSFVFTRIVLDTSYTGRIDSIVGDTAHRIDMFFVGDPTEVEYGNGLIGNVGNLAATRAIGPAVPQYLNYFLPWCSSGIVNVHGYQTLTREVFNNVDIMFTGNNAGLKYYLIFTPTVPGLSGAPVIPPDSLKQGFSGADSIYVDTSGALHVATKIGGLTFHRPIAYQEDGAGNVTLLAWQPTFSVTGSVVTYTNLGSYDTTKALVFGIDRAGGGSATTNGNLCWSTYFGGNNYDEAYGVVCDNTNNVYMAGETDSPNFPVTTVQTNVPIANSAGDAFVTKFNSYGVELWSTYFGGTNESSVNSISLNSSNDIFLCGSTACSDFPITTPSSAYTSSGISGSTSNPISFIGKLSGSNGQIIWTSYFVGAQNSVYVNSDNTIYLVGTGAGTGFPFTNPGGTSYYNTAGQGTITRFNSSLQVTWATSFGTTNATGNNFPTTLTGITSGYLSIYIIGYSSYDSNLPLVSTSGEYSQSYGGGNSDGLILQFDADDNILYSMYVGGSDVDQFTCVTSIDNEIVGSQVYIGGWTYSSDYPLIRNSASFYDDENYNISYGTVNPMGVFSNFGNTNNLAYSTYYGVAGAGITIPTQVVVTPGDAVYMVGYVTPFSGNIPTEAPSGYFSQTTFGGTQYDGFIAEFDDGSLEWSTYFGGNAWDACQGAAIDNNDNLYVVGYTTSTNFYLVNLGGSAYFQKQLNQMPDNYDNDAFISKFCIGDYPTDIQNATVQETSEITVYPNPSSNELYLELTEKDKTSFKTMELINVVGQSVVSMPFSSTIDISSLSSGMYFLKVIGNNNIKVCKFVKE